ncbi:MAG: hypothetical protein ACJ8AT_00400 [Hyalangium sp.]|uniref:hypothetical protein n=1 Tax=Hyalangium sp. TaxID=2028555 RepID=UPI00389A9028
MRTIADVYIEKGLAEGLARGRAQERAEGVLRILAARGIAVDETGRERILSCTDLDTLDRWFTRALSATRFSDLLAGE